ncbi:MAG TPA: hypothetical protein VKR06_13720 [Ktedonosporobacter sp.]|nr:hypothetical protein [Ktedonosporobacter sp.]
MLKYMLHRLRMTLHTLEQSTISQLPIFYLLEERHGRTHRMAICQPEVLLASNHLHFVGFISGKKASIEQTIVDEIERLDKVMLTEIMRLPGVLSYSSLELRTDRWYNLVILGNTLVKESFHALETHRYAAYQLAPFYYAWIRLHHGVINDGLAGQDMHLHGTKTFQFPSK